MGAIDFIWYGIAIILFFGGCLVIGEFAPEGADEWVIDNNIPFIGIAFDIRDDFDERFRGIVRPTGYGIVEVGGDGHRITLINNESARNVTRSDVIEFLKCDKTDENDYIGGVYVCSDYAEDVHNNAETAGIKCGWVSIDGIDHACNVFYTTDNGLIFVDCTEFDTIARCERGYSYTSECLNGDKCESLGTVTNYRIYW